MTGVRGAAPVAAWLDELTPEVAEQLSRPHMGIRDPWPADLAELVATPATFRPELFRARAVLELGATRPAGERDA